MVLKYPPWLLVLYMEHGTDGLLARVGICVEEHRCLILVSLFVDICRTSLSQLLRIQLKTFECFGIQPKKQMQLFPTVINYSREIPSHPAPCDT